MQTQDQGNYVRLKPLQKGFLTELCKVEESQDKWIDIPEELLPIRGYSPEPIFYVYLHKKPGTDEVFYVGKGKLNRAYVTKARNKHWQNTVKKFGGFDVEIIKEGLTEQEAFQLEAETVGKYGIENLVNKTLGGVSTTGYRHTEETKALLAEITKQRIENNPEYAALLNRNIESLHYKQRYDPEYKKLMSELQKAAYARKSPEEKERQIKLKTAWLQDEEKRKSSFQKSKEKRNTPEVRAKLSEGTKKYWESLSEEERNSRVAFLRASLKTPEIQQKTKEATSSTIVVNRMFIISPIKSFGKHYAPLQKARESASKFGFDFFVSNSYFYEEYNEQLHKDLPRWEGQEVPELDFHNLPRSKSVVMDESKVFLSMQEASIYCGGKTVDATADFITKRMREGKPAMQHEWRVATNEEIKQEILRRLQKLLENNKENDE